jgi:CSLREA domain-containing protein
MIADRAPAPVFARAEATTFTVDTTVDDDLGDAGGTTCVDTTGHCSLRAAVDAANNLHEPVTIVLRKHAYFLSSARELTVSNPAGTSVVGKGRNQTSIVGLGSRVLGMQPRPGSPTPLLFLRGLRITGGTADDGGGVYLDPATSGATLVLDKVSVTGNSATFDGGGIYAGDTSKVYADKTTFSDNLADANGGGLYTSWSDVNLTDVDITGNHGSPGYNADGGGWHNTFGVIRMTGGSLRGNTAGDTLADAYGGGLYDQYGNVMLTEVDVEHNTADGGGDGGGIYASFDLLEVDGGTISHNRATGGDTSSGGGIYTTASQVELHGVRMPRNRVQVPPETGGGGGAVYVNGSAYGAQLSVDARPGSPARTAARSTCTPPPARSTPRSTARCCRRTPTAPPTGPAVPVAAERSAPSPTPAEESPCR